MEVPRGRRYHGWSILWNGWSGIAGLCAVLVLACDAAPPGGSAPAAPQRVASVGPELGALLVELGASAQVVAADSVSRAIPGLARAADLGDPDAPSAARALAAQPDLALVLSGPSAPGAAFAAALEAEGIPAHVLDPRDANEVIAAVHRVGRLLGRELRAEAAAARLARDVSSIATQRDGRTRRRAAWVLEGEPLVVVGGSGLLHEVLELAGAENAFHTPAQDRIEVTPADLVTSAPDVVIAPVGTGVALPGTARVAVDPALAALPLLDVPGRVRALHGALYPTSENGGS